MSGHQVEFWHAGVLAKLVSLDAARLAAPGVHVAWVDVDQDANRPWRIAYPARQAGGLVRGVWDVSGGGARDEGLALGGVPPMAVGAVPDDAYSPEGRSGLETIGGALGRAKHAANAAAQFGDAAFALAGEVGQGVQRLSALSLSSTALFGELVERMTRDPEPCCRAYNDAVAAHPGAGVRPLEAGGELPLWSISSVGIRRRVFVGEVPGDGVLAPKALFMTLLLRIAACDMFVHGLGGEQYDKVMEAWAGAWLSVRLAPAAAASATRLIAFPGVSAPTPERIRQARWAAAHARHDPGLVGDEVAMAEKAGLVAEIAGLPRRSAARRAVYERLLGVVEALRGTHAGEIERLEAEATRLARARDLAGIVHDRTWAFPILEQPALVSLRSEIREAFSSPPHLTATARSDTPSRPYPTR